MNHVLLSGNLTRDPEVRYLAGGKAVTDFTLAVNEHGRDGKEYTSFVRCSAWGDTGLRLADDARTGTRLVIEGKLAQRTWTDKDGKKHDDLRVTALAVDLVLRKPDAASPPSEDLGDLPF